MTQVASGVGSVNGNTRIVAGNTLTIAASDVAAGGDVVLSGKDVVLEARQDTVVEHGSQSSKSSGFSTGITLNPVESYQQARDGATKNVPKTGSALNELSRTGEGVAAGSRAASTAVVVSAGSNQSNRQQDRANSNARVSQVSAGGDLTIVASTGSITSQGAQLAAEGDAVLLAKQDIVFDVAHNTQRQGSDDNGSGWGVANNTTGLPVGMHNNDGNGQGATDTITGTQLSVGGSTLMATQEGDITLTAANVVSQGDTTINAARNLTIQSGQDTVGNQNQTNNKAIGTVVISDTERFSGYHSEDSSDRNSGVTQVASNVGSLGGNVNLSAGNAYTQTASNVLAGNDLNVKAKTIDILTADDIGSQQSSDDSFKFGVFGRVTSPLIDLVNNVDAARQSDGRLQALQGAQNAIGAVQAGRAINDVANGGDAVLLRAEAGIGVATSDSQFEGNARTAQGSTLTAGGNLNLTATEGDIRVVQGKLGAGDTVNLEAANNIVLEAGQSGHDQQGSSHYAGAEVGVGVAVGAQTGVYIYGQASAGGSKQQESGTRYQNTTVSGSTVNLSSGGDTTLRGAQVQGEHITAKVGGDLNIESLQDTLQQEGSSNQIGGRVQASIGTAWSAEGGASASSSESNYAGVNEQSGLFAGAGGFDITVGGNTDLKGGAIGSTAGADNNRLLTASLTSSELNNIAEGKTRNIGIGGGGALDGLSNDGVGLNQLGGASQSDSSITRSDIAAGTVIVGNGDTTALDSLDRSVTGIDNSAALKPVDLQQLQDDALATQIAGQLGMQGAGSLAAALQQQAVADMADKTNTPEQQQAAIDQLEFWGDGGTGKALLHGVAGALSAAAGNGDLGLAAGGAVAGEVVTGIAIDYLNSQGINPDSATGQSILQAVTAATGGVVGGIEGANTALNGELYNRQLHPDEISWLSNNAEEFAAQVYGCGDSCTPEQIQTAKSRLIVEAFARVDGAMAEQNIESDAEAQGFINTRPVTFSWGEGFTATREQYNDFKYFGDLLSNDKQALTELATALGDAGWTKRDFQDAYSDQLAALADTARGNDGVAMAELFTGDIGMALSVVHKLATGNFEGAGLEAAIAVLPWGVGKTLRPLAPAADGTYWVNGRIISSQWVNQTGDLTWRNPLTNVVEVIPDTAKVHIDHVLPKKVIKGIDGFDELPESVQKQLLDDPSNLQPMVAPANCSKGCKVEGVNDGWEKWGDQPVSPTYKEYLQRNQDTFREKVRSAIDAYRGSQRGVQ